MKSSQRLLMEYGKLRFKFFGMIKTISGDTKTAALTLTDF